MSDKEMTLEEAIAQLNSMIGPSPIQASPTKIFVNPSQMSIIRKMMDAGVVPNNVVVPPKDIYEAEE
jgi:hypothetical protein